MIKNKLLIYSILSLSAAFALTACGSDNKSTTPLQENNVVSDDAAPQISMLGDSNLSLTIGDTFTDAGATAQDDKDGNLTSALHVSSDVNTSKAGAYSVSYSVTDSKGHTTTVKRFVTVSAVTSPYDTIPIDSNTRLGGEKGILYYADPRPEENGLNRALRIDYNNMSYNAVAVNGINPHSIDRAGSTDKFYIRTQNSYSFDVVNFKNDSVRTIDLQDHKPRAIGAYNKKYNLQILSGKDMPVVDVIDVAHDRVLATLGDRHTYAASQITSNAGAGSATGHAFWLDDDHFGMIDRVHNKTTIYKVIANNDGSYDFQQTSSIESGTAFHAIERDREPKTKKDITTFYTMGEGDLTKGFVPFVLELTFDPKTGILSRTGKAAYLSESNAIVNKIKPTTHHSGVSPDGKYLVVPVLDGKVYFIDRATMDVVKVVEAKLGAAHIEFSDKENLAIITNHFSNFLTIIDMATLTVKKNIQIGFHHTFDPDHKHLFQPHFSYVDPSGEYYYTFATQDGDFLKIDLRTLEIVDKMHTGGAPEQAHS